MNALEICERFIHYGYAVVPYNLDRSTVVDDIKRELWSREYELEHYHRAKRTEAEHTELQAKCQEIIRPIAASIVRLDYQLFSTLIGHDLHVQTKPFLRIARPGVDTDNIGFHRDTWYGDTPYEVAVWVPLTNTVEESALRLLPGSHIAADADHPYVQEERYDVVQGGLKHSLGFLYAPKKLLHTQPLIPLPVRVGEMIVFSLALLHGQEINHSQHTRWSVDFRVVNSYAPIKWERSRSGASHYSSLTESPVAEVARKYYAAAPI